MARSLFEAVHGLQKPFVVLHDRDVHTQSDSAHNKSKLKTAHTPMIQNNRKNKRLVGRKPD